MQHTFTSKLSFSAVWPAATLVPSSVVPIAEPVVNVSLTVAALSISAVVFPFLDVALVDASGLGAFGFLVLALVPFDCSAFLAFFFFLLQFFSPFLLLFLPFLLDSCSLSFFFSSLSFRFCSFSSIALFLCLLLL